MDAVVLAGGQTDAFATVFGVPNKSLIPFGGKPLGFYTLEALRVAGLNPIWIGPHHEGLAGITRLEDQGSMLGNLSYGIQQCSSQKVLVCTADMPFIDAAAITWMLEHAPNADLVYSIVQKSVIEQAFAGMRRTYAKVAGVHYTGGNAFVVQRDNFSKALPAIQKAFSLRKKPLALASMIGYGTLFKVLAGTITVPTLEQRISAMIGLQVRALDVPFAGIGVDIDQQSDLQWERLLRS